MLVLLLVGQLLSPSNAITWQGPKLTPQEAADILRPNQFIAPLELPDGPKVFIISGSPTSGPFGSFPEYRFSSPLNCCSTYVIRFPWRRYGQTSNETTLRSSEALRLHRPESMQSPMVASRQGAR